MIENTLFSHVYTPTNIKTFSWYTVYKARERMVFCVLRRISRWHCSSCQARVVEMSFPKTSGVCSTNHLLNYLSLSTRKGWIIFRISKLSNVNRFAIENVNDFLFPYNCNTTLLRATLKRDERVYASNFNFTKVVVNTPRVHDALRTPI